MVHCSAALNHSKVKAAKKTKRGSFLSMTRVRDWSKPMNPDREMPKTLFRVGKQPETVWPFLIG